MTKILRLTYFKVLYESVNEKILRKKTYRLHEIKQESPFWKLKIQASIKKRDKGFSFYGPAFRKLQTWATEESVLLRVNFVYMGVNQEDQGRTVQNTYLSVIYLLYMSYMYVYVEE